jgi:hypothetical protein
MYAFTLCMLIVKVLSFCTQSDQGYIIYFIEISVVTGSATLTRALLVKLINGNGRPETGHWLYRKRTGIFFYPLLTN